jgi:uncharacterized protein (TIGR02147 family)
MVLTSNIIIVLILSFVLILILILALARRLTKTGVVTLKSGVKKNIFEYDNFRNYLRDVYQSAKAEDKKFSFRYFSKMAGLKSPSSLKRVMDGERNLTDDGIEKFSKALKLTKEEATYFRNLVNLNQEASIDEKQKYAREILRSKAFRKAHPLTEAEYDYYSKWYHIPIRELVGLPDFQEDPAWIAAQVIPEISPQEARKAIETLLKLGLLERNPEGKLTQSNAVVFTPDEVLSSFVAQYHREMAKKAGESIERVKREKREISSMTMGMSEETARKVKEMIQKFRQDIVQLVVQDQAGDTVYQLNFHLFPVTQVLNKENS